MATRVIGNRFRRLMMKNAKFTMSDKDLHDSIYVYVAPTYGVNVDPDNPQLDGQHIEDFITKLNNADSSQRFEISLANSAAYGYESTLKGNVINRSRTIINTDPTIVSSSLLDDTKQVLTNVDLSGNEYLLFFSFVELQESEDASGVIEGSRVYMMTNFDKTTNAGDGSFSQGIMTLKRIHAYNLVNKDGEAIEVVFNTRSTQPLNVKTINITFDAFAAVGAIDFHDDTGLKQDTTFTNSDDFFINYMYPQTASSGRTVVWENPWVGQYRWMLEWIKQEKLVAGDADNPVTTGYVYSNNLGEMNIPANLRVGAIGEWPNVSEPDIIIVNAIPSTEYFIRCNRNGWGTNYDSFQEWYVGTGANANEVDDSNIIDTAIMAGVSGGNGLALFDNKSRAFDQHNNAGKKIFPNKSPWDNWNGYYNVDFFNTFAESVVFHPPYYIRDSWFLGISKPTPSDELTSTANTQRKESLINGNNVNFNGVNFITQVPSPLVQEPARDPSPNVWSPSVDNKYLLLLPIKDTDPLEFLYGTMTNSAGNNLDDTWNTSQNYLIKKHNGETRLSMDVLVSNSPALSHNRIPQNAFLSKVFADTNGWPTDNKIQLELNQETKLNDISISAYGGDYITIEYLDANGDPAKAEYRNLDGSTEVIELLPRRYKAIQHRNRLLTKTTINYGIPTKKK